MVSSWHDLAIDVYKIFALAEINHSLIKNDLDNSLILLKIFVKNSEEITLAGSS
jgi:hypothetical protein